MPTNANANLGRQWEHLPVEYVPTNELEGLEGNVLDQDKLAPLRESIPTEGIKEPVHIMYNHKTGDTFIGEGNHRVAVARELGLSEVPAMVHRTSWTLAERLHQGRADGGLTLPGRTRSPYQGERWFGAEEPPSRAGFSGRKP